MVRALPFDCERGPNLPRILALATAIALHVLVFLLLLVPMAMPRVETAPPAPQPPRWLLPETVPVTPPPAAMTAPKPPEPQARLAPRPAIETPRPVDAPSMAPETGLAVPVSVPAPDAIASDTAPSRDTPLQGAQLQYLSASPPPYPRDAARTGAEGTVLLQILVDTDGTPLQVNVQKSSGNRSLDENARKHVLKHWRFHPAQRDGRPVQAYGLVPIDFRMGNG